MIHVKRVLLGIPAVFFAGLFVFSEWGNRLIMAVGTIALVYLSGYLIIEVAREVRGDYD